MPLVGIYTRRATDGPDTQAHLERQEAACRVYCEANGLTVAAIHHEIAAGTTYQRRDKLNLVRRRYYHGEIEGIVVSDIDRLSRSLVHLVILIGEFDDYGVTLHCAREPLESTVQGRIVRLMTYPQIFSTELYEQVLARATVNKEESARNGQNPENYLLRAGFIRCANCNHAMVGIVKRDKRWNREELEYMCQPTKDCPGHYVPSVRLDTEVWAEMVKLADHVSLIETAIRAATRTDNIQANLRGVEATIAEWQQIADNYTGDLQNKDLRGTTRAAILKSLDDANAVIERLEIERRQILAGAYDKEREKQAYADILAWCKTVKDAREELSYQQKRDFLRMLGVVVLVKKVNRNLEEMSYDIRVQLPSIQELIYQNGAFVGQSLMRRP
jgi:Resolvase, N terminal domain/Recombinase zinc beta ribbon domain